MKHDALTNRQHVPARTLCGIALGLLAGCGVPSHSLHPRGTRADVIVSADPVFPTCVPLTISSDETGNAPVHIIAEYPLTQAERQTGLQGRFPLPETTAMLFSFDGTQPPVLWMKDTPAPLDMVFMARDGSVTYVEPHTTPYSTAFISPEEPDPVAVNVLELPAGRALDLGLFPGMSRVDIAPAQACSHWSEHRTE